LADGRDAKPSERWVFGVLHLVLCDRHPVLRAVQLVQSAQGVRGPLPEPVGHRGAVSSELRAAAGESGGDESLCDAVYVGPGLKMIMGQLNHSIGMDCTDSSCDSLYLRYVSLSSRTTSGTIPRGYCFEGRSRRYV